MNSRAPIQFTLCLYITVQLFLPPKNGQPLNNGQMLVPNVSIIQRFHCIWSVLYKEVPLYVCMNVRMYERMKVRMYECMNV